MSSPGQFAQLRRRSDDGVAEDDVRSEEADVAQPLDRRHAVAAGHLQELVDRLRGVQRQRHAQTGRGLAGAAEQILGAGIDLGRREEPLDPAVLLRRRAPR